MGTGIVSVPVPMFGYCRFEFHDYIFFFFQGSDEAEQPHGNGAIHGEDHHHLPEVRWQGRQRHLHELQGV